MASQSRYWNVLVLGVLLSWTWDVGIALAGKPSGALKSFAIVRSWSDATGKFKIEGQLDFADKSVAQIKTTAGKLVKIPHEKLSESDLAFVNAFLAAEAAVPGATTDGESSPFEVVDSSNATANESPAMDVSNDATFSVAELPSEEKKSPPKSKPNANKATGAPESKAATPEVPRRPVFTKTSRPIPLSFDRSYWKGKPAFGLELANVSDLSIATDVPKPFFAGIEVKAAGKSPLAVLNVFENGREAPYSHFMAVSMVDGESAPAAKFDIPIKLMALSPDGKKALGLRLGGPEPDSALIMMSIDASGIKLEFEFVAGGGDWDGLTWATFLPNNRLMTVSSKNNVSVWDIANPKGVALYSRGNLGAPMPIMTSIGNDQIAVVHKQSIAIVDASELKQTGCIVCDKPILSACFAHDGTKIAIQMPYELATYSLVDGLLLRSIPTSFPDKQPLTCFGKYATVGNLLFDTELGIPLWMYEGLSEAQSLADLSIRAFGGDQGTRLASAKLPHPAAIRASEDFGSKDRYAVIPGTAVRIDVVVQGNFGQQQQIEEAMRENILRAGWKVKEDAEIVVIASLEQGEMQKEEYVTREGRFGPPPPFFNASGPVDEVTFTPWTHKVEIRRGDEILYTNVRYIGSPQSFESEEGESTQATINRLVQPQVNYYKTLNLPPYLYKPELQNGFGKSTFEATGLQSAN